MLRLIRFALILCAVAVVAYFAVTVPLGSNTLWGHLRAIAGTDESKELVEGVKAKAGEVLQRADAEADEAGNGSASDGDGAADDLEARDREQLRKLIRKRLERGQDPSPKPLK